MIEAHQLSRRYGDFLAVEQISFAVDEGEILGILGPNGAGKTTTIRMVTGFLPPTGGRVTVAGRDLLADGAEARRHIGYLPENVSLYGEMRVHEYLGYRARLHGLRRGDARTAIDEAVERCLLTEVRGQIIGTLSKGYRQRVGLAAAILHRPEVLVLDEPTVGLDPKQIIAIRELIRELGRQQTLLLSTHILPEVELLCDRILILDGGRIVDQGTPEALRARWVGATVLRLGFEAGTPVAAAVTALEEVPGVAAVRSQSSEPPVLLVECEAGADPRPAVFRRVVEAGWVLIEMTEQKASLEDIFVRLTTREAVSSEAPVAESGAMTEASEPLEADEPGEAGGTDEEAVL